MAVSSLSGSNSYSFNLSISEQTTSSQKQSQKSDDVLNSSSDDLIQKVKDGELTSKDITTAYQMSFMAQTLTSQNAGSSKQTNNDQFDISKVKELLQGMDAKAIGYDGKNLSDLTQEEAAKLVSEDGYFGIKKTSDRMSDFVINGAGNDLEKLKQGREGVIRGYNEAEAAWGGKLPDISKKTLEETLAKIDKQIEKLGGNAIDTIA